MASQSSTTYLITDPNRGIGHGLLRNFLSRPYSTCITAVRDPSASKTILIFLPTGTGSKLIVVKIDSSVATDTGDAAKELRDIHKIERIHVVIASAGIGNDYVNVTDLKLEALQEHIDVNVFGPLTLFQAMLPLLTASPSPRFCFIGSALGSIGGMGKCPIRMAEYGMSKAMAHYLVRKIHFEYGSENGKLVAWCVHPGFVQTDSGKEGARRAGMAEAPDTIEDSAAFVAETIDDAIVENTGGRFPSFYGGEIEW